MEDEINKDEIRDLIVAKLEKYVVLGKTQKGGQMKMDNKMKLIANSFDLEIDEEFDICLENDSLSMYGPYKFTLDRGVVDKDGHGCPTALARLLIGQYTIKKLPWKPIWHKLYWFIQYCGVPCCANFVSDIDVARLNMGNCFASRYEAEKATEHMLKKFISISEGVRGGR